MKQTPDLIEVVDNFCGGGGTSTGVERAAKSLGLKVRLVGVNHWKVAIATYSTNHKKADVHCQAVGSVNPLQVVPGGRLRLMVASPECTGHSNARGGKPTSEQHRADAWELMRWIEEVYVENILIENVREFVDWGPLGADGKPLKSKKGLYFKQFVSMLEVNYKVETRILNAADYGDATTRERFFLIARRPEHKPIFWPEPTHASRAQIEHTKSQPSLFPGRKLKPWRSAREIIDWTLDSHSIFLTREDVRRMKLKIKRPLSPNTLARIFAGLERYSGLSFVLPNEGFHRGNAPRSVEEPLNTVTSRGAGGLAQPWLLNLKGSARRDRSIDEPTFTQATANHQGVVQPFVLNIRGGRDGYTRGAAVDEPLQTVTGITPFALVDPFLMNMQHATGEGGGGHGRYCYPLDRPLTTIAGKGMYGLIEPFLLQYFGERGGQRERVREVDAPLWTITGQRVPGLVEADSYLVKSYTGSDACSLDAPLPTITATVEHLALASPFITKFHGNHKGRTDGNGRTHSVEEPLPTADGSNRFGLALPFVVPVNHGAGDTRTREVGEPMPTLTQFDAWGLAEPYLVKFYGTATGQSVDEPLDTVTAKDRFGLVLPEVALVIPSLGVMLDIRFRMLQPHELAAATGFPRSYVFTGTRDEKVKQIGNAVPVNLAAALVRSILTSDEKAKPKAARRKAA
jgi:DNA (cytosine-5)-methyltransferase 1